MPDKRSHRGAHPDDVALFGAAATTMVGFGLLVFVVLPPIQQFGGISALAILFSFFASVFVLPSILSLWARVKMRKEGWLDGQEDEAEPMGEETEEESEEEPKYTKKQELEDLDEAIDEAKEKDENPEEPD